MTESKKCFKCEEIKPLTDFYKHSGMKDGRVNKCKECNKKDVRENRKSKVEYYRQYDKDRFKNDPKVKYRHERYKNTDAGKESIRKAKEKWSEENPIKRGASTMVGNAVRDGKLTKPKNCSQCGVEPERLHGHHDDYAKPLEVRWLCPKCHTDWHKENGEGLNA